MRSSSLSTVWFSYDMLALAVPPSMDLVSQTYYPITG
jgi:hypothetical protein